MRKTRLVTKVALQVIHLSKGYSDHSAHKTAYPPLLGQFILRDSPALP